MIHVAGADMALDSLCWIGHDASSAHHISSALVACEVGSLRDGLVQVEVATRFIPSGLRAGQAATLEAYMDVGVMAVTPSSGVFSGGDVIEVHGGPMPAFMADIGLGCRVGTIGPVSAKWVSDASVECVALMSSPFSTILVSASSCACITLSRAYM